MGTDKNILNFVLQLSSQFVLIMATIFHAFLTESTIEIMLLVSFLIMPK